MSSNTNNLVEILEEKVNSKGYNESLEQNLQDLSKSQSRNIQRFHKVTKTGDFSDKKFVKSFMKTMVDGKKMTAICGHIHFSTLTFFRLALDEKIKVDEKNVHKIDILLMGGYLFLYREGDEFFVYVTEEVKSAFQELEISILEGHSESNTIYYDFALAAVELYGTISWEELLKIYKQYHPDVKITKKEYQKVVSTFLSVEKEIFVQDDAISSGFFADDEEALEELQETQKGVSRFLPTKKEEFLRYLDKNYMRQTPESKDVIKFFQKIDPNPVRLKTLMTSLHFDQQLSADLESSVYTVHYSGYFPIDKKEQNIMLHLLTIMDSFCKKWVYNGYSLQELHNIAPRKYPLPANMQISQNVKMIRSESPVQVVKNGRPVPLPKPSKNMQTPSTQIQQKKKEVVQPTPEQIAKAREMAKARKLAQMRKVNSEPSKNGLCSCGSGKKYKRCCGNK